MVDLWGTPVLKILIFCRELEYHKALFQAQASFLLTAISAT
jgi:hypothetical protein